MFKATVNQRQIIGMRAQSAKISKNYKCYNNDGIT